MAKRDPYHHLSLRAYTCRDSRSEARDLERAAIRRARHAGKREAHAAVIDAAEISFDRWYDDFCARDGDDCR